MVGMDSYSAWLYSMKTISWRLTGKVNCIQELLWPPVIEPGEDIAWAPVGECPIKAECVADGKPVPLPPVLPPSVVYGSVKFRNDLLVLLEAGVLPKPVLVSFTVNIWPGHWLQDTGLVPKPSDFGRR